MANIRILALEAFSPSNGLIGVYAGRPALSEHNVATIAEAKILCTQLHNALICANKSHKLMLVCVGRKPPGFDKIRHSLSYEWVKQNNLEG